MKAGDQPATHYPNYKRQCEREYKSVERADQAYLAEYRHPHKAPRSADWVARLEVVAHIGPEEGEREDQHAAKNPHAPTCQKCSGGNLLVPSNFVEQTYRNGFHCLTPVPHDAMFPQVLFGKIPKHRVIVGTASKVFQQPSRYFRWSS